MLKFGGHILLSNTCLVPVRHLAMRAVLHLVLLAQCIAVKKCLTKPARVWLLDFVWFCSRKWNGLFTRVYHFVDYTWALWIDLVSLVVQSWKRAVVFKCPLWKLWIIHDPSALSKLWDQMSNTTRSYFPMEPPPFCSHYVALPFFSSVALLFFTSLWFQFVSRMSAYCLQKKVRFGHVQKLRNIFKIKFVKLRKNKWQGKNPTKWLWKNCPWSWVPDKVEALQNGPGVFLGVWMQLFDHFWMKISKSLLKKKVQYSWQRSTIL